MGFLLVIFIVTLVFVFRWGRRIMPMIKTIADKGEDIGGWTIFYMFGGVHVVGGILTSGARILLWTFFVIGALFDWTIRVIFIVVIIWKLFKRRNWKNHKRLQLQKANMTANELEVIDDAVRKTFELMGLTSKGAEPIPPNCLRWKKSPVKIGGRALKNHYRFDCLIEPAPGRSISEMIGYVSKGIDAGDDRLRDALNGTLRAARGRKVTALRKAKLMPGPFVLTTLEHATKNGEKIGLGRLTLWTTDPFRRPIKWPYPMDKRIMHKLSDPCPIGLYRSNREATSELDVMTGVMGSNGSGKSKAITPMLVGAAWTDAIIICIALKGSRDYVKLSKRFAGGMVITEPDQASNIIRWAKGEIRRRNSLDSEELSKCPDIMIVIDEAQELRGDISLIIPNVKLGRSAGVYTYIVTQYAPASVKPEDGGCPTTLLRELRRRMSGRIEGSFSNAVVAVGDRVTKSSGPHLIPTDRRWAGVLFDNDGRYIRSYFVSSDGEDSQLAQLAKALPTRPKDPEGFIEALRKAPVDLIIEEMEFEFPEDGSERAADGSLRALEYHAVSSEIQESISYVWEKAGRRNPPSGRIIRSELAKSMSGAKARMEKRVTLNEIDTDSVLLNSLQTLESFMMNHIAERIG